MISVRRRLLFLLLSTFGVIWLGVITQVYRVSGQQAEILSDTELVKIAKIVAAFEDAAGLDPEALHRRMAEYSPAPAYERGYIFQLWQSGELMLVSRDTPTRPLGNGPGFTDLRIDGRRWRCYGFATDTPGEILYVGESYDLREELAWEVTLSTLTPMLWSMPVLGLLTCLAVGRGLRPLGRVARDIGRRRPGQLDPVPEGGVPREIRPLTTALNRLLRRLDAALDKEQRFTADAAHELRTPLAVIRTHAQIAARSHAEEERREALRNVVLGVDRAAHLVGQMLVLVRLEPDDRDLDMTACSLEEITGRVVGELAPLAARDATRLVLDVRGDGPWLLPGLDAGLEVLVRNLLDNALKHTPNDGCVLLRLRRSGGNLHLLVADDGPGIPRVLRKRVLERFYRPPGTRAAGAGLGLAIVDRVCRLHNARLWLGRGLQGRGLCVRVVFPVSAREVDGPGARC